MPLKDPSLKVSYKTVMNMLPDTLFYYSFKKRVWPESYVFLKNIMAKSYVGCCKAKYSPKNRFATILPSTLRIKTQKTHVVSLDLHRATTGQVLFVWSIILSTTLVHGSYLFTENRHKQMSLTLTNFTTSQV